MLILWEIQGGYRQTDKLSTPVARSKNGDYRGFWRTLKTYINLYMYVFYDSISRTIAPHRLKFYMQDRGAEEQCIDYKYLYLGKIRSKKGLFLGFLRDSFNKIVRIESALKYPKMHFIP